MTTANEHDEYCNETDISIIKIVIRVSLFVTARRVIRHAYAAVKQCRCPPRQLIPRAKWTEVIAELIVMCKETGA